jgi:hypothetical protein
MYPVSIGRNCTTAFQIKRHLKKLDASSDVSRQFFDWLFMGEALGVAELFRSKLNFDLACFYAHETTRGFVPRDKQSGMAFLHDFKSGHFPTEKECLLAITKEWSNFSEKYDYLKKKFYRFTLEKDDLVFVYYGKINEVEWNALEDAILETFQKEVPIINFLGRMDYEASSKSNRESFLVEKRSQDPSVALWKGDDVSWDAALGTANSKMENDIHFT